MPHYHEIQPLAFRLRDDKDVFTATVQTLSFPDPWKTALHAVQSKRSGRNPAESRLKIGVLNKALRALVPDLIAIAPNADKRDAQEWLIARRPIDVQALHWIVDAWVREEYADGDAKTLRSILESLKPNDLQWRPQTFDLGRWSTSHNGTAVMTRDEAFVLLPDFLADQIGRHDVVFELGSECLRFRRAPLRPGGQGAELVSWPPQQSRRGNQQWHYSVVITLTVQTVPFQPFPVIHCDLGLRRWVSRPVTYLPAGEETSVFLLTSAPWLDRLPRSTGFQIAPIRWERASAGNGAGRYVWGSNLASILNRLVPKERAFPDPATICANPVGALNLQGDSHAALVYRNGMRPEHAIDPGIMTKVRRTLFEQIADTLQPFVTVADPLPKCRPTGASRMTVNQNPFAHTGKVNTQPHGSLRRAIIAQSIGNQLAIEMYVQTDEVRDALMKATAELLDVTIDPAMSGGTIDHPITIETPELCITAGTRQLGALGAPLDIPTSGGSSHDRCREAIRKRIDEISRQIPPATGTAVAFIELQGKDGFRGAEDPKHALRMGFALRNRLTQCITVGKDDRLDYRAKNGVLDMVRQLGVGVRLPQPQSLQLDRLGLAGLWLINRQRASSPGRVQQALPVFVSIDSNNQQINVYAPGLSAWLPYPQALLELSKAAGNGKLDRFQRPRDSIHFILDTIRREFMGTGDTVLFVHAQNARRAWPWLTNHRITVDGIAFGEEPPQPISNWRGLRIIRVRDSQFHETPEWYAKNESETGFMQGVSKINDRVFASTYGKPLQFRQARHGGGLDELAWNPAIVEFTVAALQPGDDPQRWAAYAHALRQALSHYDGATVLPLPLHLAKLASEYAIALDPRDEIDDEE
ncbi:pPIWI_RE module domain-containing protein [Roseiflexus castenholzii]|uniref:pPIWI_RE module domain-containing protein n=1 Tax=Roseiflexus castenholzii TaxID=120962 RepID=UPI0023536522